MSLAIASVVALLGTALALAVRRLAARRRATLRVRLVPGRTDEATPAELQRLFEVLHQLVLRRWWQRLLGGQPSLALELWGQPGRAGTEARLALVLPDDAALVQAVRGRLLATYRDVLLQPWDGRAVPAGALVRLKKRERFITRLRTPEDYTAPLVDAVLAAMAELAEPVLVQLALTPTPALFDRVSRWRFRAEEHARERARLREGGDPGLRSEVVGAELEGGLHVQHRPLFFCDLRVATATLAGARLVARALRGESAQENRLVERTVRLREGLYRPRLVAGHGNPLPGVRRGVISSSELTGLWHLPSPFLDVVRVARNPVPRVPAPPAVRRTDNPAQALGRDAHGLVCLHDTDKYANLALLGRPGGGKTSVMLRSALADAQDRDCALIILDPKGELADAALGHLPADGKPVHVISLGDGEAGIDPFHVPGQPPDRL